MVKDLLKDGRGIIKENQMIIIDKRQYKTMFTIDGQWGLTDGRQFLIDDRGIIIGGKKHSCAGCIGGHRSKSCRHLDRDLHEVPKPGRPANTYNATSPRSCNCHRTITLALKKTRNCPCSSTDKPESPSKADDKRPSKSSLPPVATTYTFKRDMTVKPYAPTSDNQLNHAIDQVDQSHVQIFQQPGHLPFASMGGAINYPVANGFYNGTAQPQLPQLPQTNLLLMITSPVFPTFNGNGLPHAPGHMKTDSGVGGFHFGTEYTNQVMPPSNGPGSCCARNTEPPIAYGDPLNPQLSSLVQPTQSVPLVPSAPAMNFNPNAQSAQNQIASATYLQTGATQNFNVNQFNQIPAAPTFTTHGSIQHASSSVAAPHSNAQFSVSRQKCLCGPDCNCLFCPEHPRNERTTTYVQDLVQKRYNNQHAQNGIPGNNAIAKIENDTNPNTPCSENSVHSPPFFFNGPYADLNLNPNSALNLTSTPNGTALPAHYDPTLIGTPSTNYLPNGGQIFPNSIGMEDMGEMYNSEEFLFVDYNVNLSSCTGDKEMCLCGDGCACVGCMVHDNSGAVESMGQGLVNGLGEVKNEYSGEEEEPLVKRSCCG